MIICVHWESNFIIKKAHKSVKLMISLGGPKIPQCWLTKTDEIISLNFAAVSSDRRLVYEDFLQACGWVDDTLSY